MTISIRPLHDRVRLRRIDRPKMSAGGIDISMASQEVGTHVTAEVLAIGPKVTTVTIGETVILPVHTGTKDADGCLLVKEIDLLGVVEPDAPVPPS